MSYGPLAKVTSQIVNVHKYPMVCNYYSQTLHIWVKRGDPIFPALVCPILPGIGMV